MDEAPRALSRGLLLIEAVAAQPAGLSHGGCCRVLGLPNTTVTRLLQSLCALGYLAKGDDGLYRPGERFGALGARETDEMRLRRVCLPELRGLCERFGESGTLLRWTGVHTICLERVLREDSVVLQEPGHVTQNIWQSPWGMFFRRPDDWLQALRAQRAELRRHGITRRLYDAEQRRLRDHGFACCHASGKQRLAAPLRDDSGHCLGAMCLGGTPEHLPQARIDREVGPALAAAAKHCCRALQ